MVHQYTSTQFTASPSVLAAMEKQDLEKLENVIKDGISLICAKTGLTEGDVMDVLGNVRVTMSSELPRTLNTLQEQGTIKRTDTAALSAALESAYRMIAEATDLNTDEITDMFTRLRGATMEKIVARIRTKSRMDRSDQE